jgi:preprotein translocase subunit YajC
MMTQLIPVFAEDQQPQAGPLGGSFMMFIMLLVVMFVMIVVMPAAGRRQKREQEKMLAAIKRGTKVLTNGGIVGTIVSAKDGEDEVVIRSEDTRLRIKRNVIVQVLGSDESEAAKSS